MKRLPISLMLVLTSWASHAQERCGFDAEKKRWLEQNPNYSQQVFERWLQPKIIERQARMRANRTQSGPYKIPVVVHVIHHGEAVGSGANISDAQILSQISVLNKDYQRLNADAINTPSVFQSVAGSLNLEFVLAKQDPEGLPSTGIVRVKGPKASWNIDPYTQRDVEFKYLSYWPAEDYLNIWVINCASSYIGYAQFPQTTLPGLEPPYGRLTDGVVIDYKTFGSVDDGAFPLESQFNKGRTATHEIGHFFGLLHTFEGGCNSPNDYVSDTPPQSESTRNCPAHPATSCSGTKMFQNFLDYTDDACMNLFTTGQTERMVTVLESSPRRLSLLTSHGLNNPTLVARDAEARTILSPEKSTCGQSVTPRLQIRNRGTTTITTVRVAFLLNSVVQETKTFNLALPSLELQTIEFSAVSLDEPSTNTVGFEILEVNGSVDDELNNNTVSSSVAVPTRINVPYSQTFNSLPADWLIVNPDGATTWSLTTAPNASASNKAVFMDFFNYDEAAIIDQLRTPFIALTSTASAVLRFDRAYARFQGKNTDSLRVLLFEDCQTDPLTAVTLFKAGGSELATAADKSSIFIPSSETQWKTEVINLNPYLGKNIQVVFQATNGYGNNLYLDNIQFSIGSTYDVALTQINGPAPVICTSHLTPTLTIQNLGGTTVTTVLVTPTVNGVAQASQTAIVSLASGTDSQVQLSSIPLGNGTNTVSFSVTDPNAPGDEVPGNNVVSGIWIVEPASAEIPVRQRFDEWAGWTAYAPTNQTNWVTTSTNYGNSAYYNAYGNPNRGQEAWLVSPVLDLSTKSVASIFADYSYGLRANGSEHLRVIASTDCGETYPMVLFDQTGLALSAASTSNIWKPTSEAQWLNQYFDLNSLAGEAKARVAFVLTNDNGNNFYIDNIEFFEDDDPTPPKINERYLVYSSTSDPHNFNITFNLEEKSDSRLQVFSILGQVMMDTELPDMLNQTYTVNMEGTTPGIYIARLQVGSELSSFKVFIGH